MSFIFRGAARGCCAREVVVAHSRAVLASPKPHIRGTFHVAAISGRKLFARNPGGTGPLPAIRGHEFSCTTPFQVDQGM